MKHVFVTLILLIASPVLAQSGAQWEDEEEEFVAELIHSDLPLYTFEWENFWPRGFVGEGSFGCVTKVSYGDWQFTSNPAFEFGDSWWLRISNYGVFHCGANILEAYDREELVEGDFSRGFFVQQGEAEHDGKTLEIWALQRGMVPGSDYILLAREPKEGLAEKFTVLQRRCPQGARRELEGGLDVWLTDYCAINSREELWDLSMAMLEFPALGTLELRSDSEEASAAP